MDARTHYEVGLALLESGSLEEARWNLERAVEMDSELDGTRVMKGGGPTFACTGATMRSPTSSLASR